MQGDSDTDSTSGGRSATVCFLCRQRKTKCDRTLPRCGFCIKAKADCQYVPGPKKRGLRAGYVSELERRIGTLESEVHELKTAKATSSFPTPASHPSHPGHDANDLSSLVHTPTITPSPWSGSPKKRRRIDTESDAAVRDLMTLPHDYLYSLADLWFKENQQWTPFLSHKSIQRGLQLLPDPVDHIECIELKALLALEIAYSTQAISLGYHGRRRLSQYLRSQVLTEAMSNASMSSIGALLIIAQLDYGNDDISSTFSILSVCRRTCEHLGLFRKLLRQIEMSSPTQVGPPAAASTEDDVSTIATAWGVLALDAVSTLGVSWRDVSAALVDHLSSVAYISSPDLRDSFRTHVHLAAIGLQPIHSFLHDISKHPPTQLDDDMLAKCDEMYQNLMMYASSQPSASYTILPTGQVDFDPNTFHTVILSHASVIIFYGPLVTLSTSNLLLTMSSPLTSPSSVFPPTTHSLPQPTSPIPFSTLSSHNSTTTNTINPSITNTSISDSSSPISRIKSAVSSLALSIRNISDADAELNTPLLATFLFVAARFKLVLCRSSHIAHRDANSTSPSHCDAEFDTIMHGINMCGRRWPVARRLDIVLRKAVGEVDRAAGLSSGGYEGRGQRGETGGGGTERNGGPDTGRRNGSNDLPPEFWDLTKSHLDISAAMKNWVEERKGDLYIGSLNGPYA